MIHSETLASISNEELFATVQHLTARCNVALADLLAHLGEVEHRGIHRERACATLYTYCVYELRMSEDAAYRRSRAARLVREYPELYDAIAKGEIHLTGVLMIGPYLGGERHGEVLRRARFRSKRELLRILAEIDPKPEVPALVEPIGPAPAGLATHAAFVRALGGPVRELPQGRRPEDWMAESAVEMPQSEPSAHSADAEKPGEPEEPGEPDSAEHQRALRYKVQFTADQEFVDLLQEASDLIGHETPKVTLPEIQLPRSTRTGATAKGAQASRDEGGARAGAGGVPDFDSGARARCRAGATRESTRTGRGTPRGIRSRWGAMRLSRRPWRAMPRDLRARASPSSRVRVPWSADARKPRAPMSFA